MSLKKTITKANGGGTSIYVAVILTCFLFTLTSPARAEEPKSYTDKCAGCHTIGGGALVGPDLAATKSWDNAKLRSEIKRMEAMAGPLTDTEVDELTAFLKNPSAQVKTQAPTDASASPGSNDVTGSQESLPVEKVLPGSSEQGRLLFMGSKPLSNGGMSCIACHQGSSTKSSLGPDLKGVDKKFAGKALVSACQQAAFKVMRPAYKDHQITESEALDLSKYLSSKEAAEVSKEEPVILYGGAFSLLVLVTILLGYRARPRGARQKLQRR
ncbi:MAG: c-type cytochrome [Candidatus Obscuribacterales bacterium]|nr:c-type cytochrome [Candidatus Obscuribacterales bacterium]